MKSDFMMRSIDDVCPSCPNCGRTGYMRLMTGSNVGRLNVKCLNCNTYFEWDKLMDAYPMTIHKAVHLLHKELECVKRDCERKCADCDLVQDRDKLIDMYNWVLDYIYQKEEE